MIIVIPCSAKYEYDLDYPCIVDNGWCQEGKPSVKKLIDNIRKYKPEFAIALDGNLELSLKLMKKFPNIKWVYPAHDVSELEYWKYGFLIGLPTRWKQKLARNYNIKTYLEKVPKGYRFILGLSYKDFFELPIQEFDYCDIAFIFTNAVFGKDIRGRKIKYVNIHEQLKKLIKIIEQKTIIEYLK